MGSNNFNRRDFLKLLQLLPLTFVRPPDREITQAKDDGHNLPNILIVLFDALSASNMSLYGYPRQTTPNLDRIASQATVFNRHYAGGNWTSPGSRRVPDYLSGFGAWLPKSPCQEGRIGTPRSSARPT